MCISHSGRCLLSNFMAGRESNRGECCQPCRYQYAVLEALRPGEYFPIAEDDRGSYIFNARDLCMVEHIPQMIRAGIDSLKIEGRMKSLHYVATAVNVYREAIDACLADPESLSVEAGWLQELEKIGTRGYCTGFYLGNSGPESQTYTLPSLPKPVVFAGKIIDVTPTGEAVVAVRNRIFNGDSLEILSARGPVRKDTIREMTDEKGTPLSPAQPNSVAVMRLESPCVPNDLIRKIKKS